MSAYFCPHCKVMATFESGGPGWTWNNRAHFVWRCHNCNGLVYAMVEAQTAEAEIWPSLRSEAPEELPEVVRDNLSEAIRSVNANNPRAAVVMTRSALQAATREQGAQGKNLREEIDDLVQKHVIPESLGTWAHEIREAGIWWLILNRASKSSWPMLRSLWLSRSLFSSTCTSCPSR